MIRWLHSKLIGAKWELNQRWQTSIQSIGLPISAGTMTLKIPPSSLFLSTYLGRLPYLTQADLDEWREVTAVMVKKWKISPSFFFVNPIEVTVNQQSIIIFTINTGLIPWNIISKVDRNTVASISSLSLPYSCVSHDSDCSKYIRKVNCSDKILKPSSCPSVFCFSWAKYKMRVVGSHTERASKKSTLKEGEQCVICNSIRTRYALRIAW